jgi:hypothetical protein
MNHIMWLCPLWARLPQSWDRRMRSWPETWSWPECPPWWLPLALSRGLEYGKGQEETAALAGRTLDPGLATVGLGYAADD